MMTSATLDLSFSGLKTAVAMLVRRLALDDATRADVAASFQSAIVDVLVAKSRAALEQSGLDQLVVAGGVGANQLLRSSLDALGAERGARVFYPPLPFCTDNGAMIALAGALRLAGTQFQKCGFSVRPRWDLQDLTPAG
jgi:N6-L-threonylcarbamoyladenine synthase